MVTNYVSCWLEVVRYLLSYEISTYDIVFNFCTFFKIHLAYYSLYFISILFVPTYICLYKARLTRTHLKIVPYPK